MQPELAKRNIRVVALSKDSVEEAAIHRTRDGLSLTLLADPELQVIRQFGVEHHKALNFTTGTFMIGTIPLALTPSFKTMAIPTSLLVDEDGVILWIDQSDDYRIRSNNERVLGAISKVFS
jgi:alkyl hydroperoxide reductase subunit AhpC